MSRDILQQQLTDAFGSDDGWEWKNGVGRLWLPSSETSLVLRQSKKTAYINVRVLQKQSSVVVSFDSSIVKLPMAQAVYHLLSYPETYRDLFLSPHKWLRVLTGTQVARLKHAAMDRLRNTVIVPLTAPLPISKEFAGHLNKTPGCRELGVWHAASIPGTENERKVSAYVVLNREEGLCLRFTRNSYARIGDCQMSFSVLIGEPVGIEPYAAIGGTYLRGYWPEKDIPYDRLVAEAMQNLMKVDELLVLVPRLFGPFEPLQKQAVADMANRYKAAIPKLKKQAREQQKQIALCESRATHWQTYLTALETK